MAAPVGAIPTTRRRPRASLSHRYRQALDATSFQDFTDAIEAIHDDVHVWVGGRCRTSTGPRTTRCSTRTTRWSTGCGGSGSTAIPGANPPANILDRPFRSGGPSGLTPRDVLDVKQLGYDYAATENKVAGPG